VTRMGKSVPEICGSRPRQTTAFYLNQWSDFRVPPQYSCRTVKAQPTLFRSEEGHVVLEHSENPEHHQIQNYGDSAGAP
jgi:hypothetical protein